MWADNAVENMERKKQCAKFRMLQIEKDKHNYVIYISLTLPFRTEVILVCIDSYSRYSYCINNFGHALDTGGVTLFLLYWISNNFLTTDKLFAQIKFHKY